MYKESSILAQTVAVSDERACTDEMRHTVHAAVRREFLLSHRQLALVTVLLLSHLHTATSQYITPRLASRRPIRSDMTSVDTLKFGLDEK